MRSAALVSLALATAAHADPKPPCTGCTLDAPTTRAAASKIPMLVVLHGDRERASVAAARWRAATTKRGWALLSLQCPKEQGCKDSWWAWDGDPAWIASRVAVVREQLGIDPARIYLAGWSGGASYIGLHASAWTPTFAGLVIHGGGLAPSEAACPAEGHPVRAYFLVGDANPLHRLARELRAWFVGCHQEHVWDVVPKGDHDREDRALDAKKARAILDWLTG
ncbi:MAG: hypothetical protein NT062_23250 [Proteobacteria bacterium]|nr:hypothetical protein [Pseudomonadota bacterium]